MTACTFCGAGEDTRRFLVRSATGSARLCDRCLCELVRHTTFTQGLEPPRGLARLGVELPQQWPLERQLRRINYLKLTGQLNVPKRIAGAIARGLARLEKQPQRARAPRTSPLSGYFVQPPVRPFARFERVCGFCGARRRLMLLGKVGGRICMECLQHASHTLLG